MKNNVLISIVLVILSGMFILSTPAFSGDIKSRMKARLHEIKALKAKGVVGENNKGYLEFISQSKDKADMVNAENKDRKIVYEKIAKAQGTTLDIVQKHRAVQIEQKAKPGEWLQDANGKWYKK